MNNYLKKKTFQERRKKKEHKEKEKISNYLQELYKHYTKQLNDKRLNWNYFMSSKMYSQRNQNMLENLKSTSYKINTRKHNFIKQTLHNDRILSVNWTKLFY